MRSRRAGIFLLLLAIVGGGLAMVYLTGGLVLTRLLRDRLPELRAAAPAEGGRIGRVEFTHAEILPLTRVRVFPVAFELTPPPSLRSADRAPVRVRTQAVTARLTGVWPPRAELRVEGIRIDAALSLEAPADVPFGGADLDVPLERIDGGLLVVPDLRVTARPAAAAREATEALRALLREGATPRALSLEARLHFRLDGSALAVRVRTAAEGERTVLRLFREDLDEVSRRLTRPLTPAERDLLAAHPLKAPNLLRMKRYAESAGARLARADPVYEEDATRHVLWAYWLAKTYGADFARQATEAHEVGSDNTPAESDRDRANNAVGIAFAEAGKTEGQVVHLIRTDPRVRRTR
jgi:hypothetical protein